MRQFPLSTLFVLFTSLLFAGCEPSPEPAKSEVDLASPHWEKIRQHKEYISDPSKLTRNGRYQELSDVPDISSSLEELRLLGEIEYLHVLIEELPRTRELTLELMNWVNDETRRDLIVESKMKMGDEVSFEIWYKEELTKEIDRYVAELESRTANPESGDE